MKLSISVLIKKIDILVTINDRLFVSGDTWLDYLKPSKARIINIPKILLEKPDKLISAIYDSTGRYHKNNQPSNHKNDEEEIK